METTILTSKKGMMNMGGYFKEKTAQVFTLSFTINGVKEECSFFRFRFIGDNCDECFNTLDKAMERFYEATKDLN
jgi:hypothetical protein